MTAMTPAARVFHPLFGLFLLAIFVSCTKKYYFTTSTVVPAAEGTVTVKKDKNDNYVVNVSTTHLASPQRLSPPKDVYVVWIQTAGNGMKNIGTITSQSGFLSSTLKGSLKAVTNFKPQKVFVTAETKGEIGHPGVPVVLTTEGIK